MAVSPDGSWLASGSSNMEGSVRIWDTATWQERGAFAGHPHGAYMMVAAPDGTWLSTVGSNGPDDGTVRVWDVARCRQRAVLAGYPHTVRAMAVSPDGSWLAVGTEGGDVWIWETATWQRRAVLYGREDRTLRAAVTPAGVRRAFTRIRDKAWELYATGDFAIVPRHVFQLVVAPDGSWIAARRGNGTVEIWDTATWRKQATLTGIAGPVDRIGSTGGQWWRDVTADLSMDVTADGSWLATGSGDGTIRIWDKATWHEQAMMRIDGALTGCTWVGANGIAVAGASGLYLFDFLASAPTAEQATTSRLAI